MSSISQGGWRLDFSKTHEACHHIFTNYCSCCITEQLNTLSGKHYLPFFAYIQRCTQLASVTEIDGTTTPAQRAALLDSWPWTTFAKAPIGGWNSITPLSWDRTDMNHDNRAYYVILITSGHFEECACICESIFCKRSIIRGSYNRIWRTYKQTACCRSEPGFYRDLKQCDK